MVIFAKGLIFRKLWGFLFVFWTGFTSFGVVISPIYHRLGLGMWYYFIWHRRDSLNRPICWYKLALKTNVNHKDWLTYSGGTDRPGELHHNFSISNDPIHMVDFYTKIAGCDCHSRTLLDHFFLLTILFVLQWLTLQWEILIMLLSQFPMTCLQTQKGMSLFYRIAYGYSCGGLDGLLDHLRNLPWEDILVLLLLLLNFVIGSSFKLMYISLIVNIRLSLIRNLARVILVNKGM